MYANEILDRLYNEDDVRLPPVEILKFGCGRARKKKCADALFKLVQAQYET